MSAQQKHKAFNMEGFLLAAFTRGEELGWTEVTPEKVAKAMGLKNNELPSQLKTRQDILDFFEHHISNQLNETFKGVNDNSETRRDQLFDIIMERFDLMTAFKGGLKRLSKTAGLLPKTAMKSICPFRAMIGNIMRLANLDVHGPMAEIKRMGLTVLYLKTVRVWLSDDSPDLGKTMAELDQNLSFAEQAMNSFIKKSA